MTHGYQITFADGMSMHISFAPHGPGQARAMAQDRRLRAMETLGVPKPRQKECLRIVEVREQ